MAIAPASGRSRPDRELQFMQRITQDFSTSQARLQTRQQHREKPANPGQSIPSQQSAFNAVGRASSTPEAQGDRENLIEHWRDRIRTLPEIRSALVPLDDIDREAEWSNAFSLPKADLEPWLSFHKGYRQSSLFAGASKPLHAESPGQADALRLQFEVQAIIALRNFPEKALLEPPVRIDRPVEYLDLIAELEACRDPLQAKSLAKIANEVHDSRLEQAVEEGREMGERLYHALLGPDCTNLSKEWKKIYQRKPTVDEMYRMLTSGRITALPERRNPEIETRKTQPLRGPAKPTAKTLPEQMPEAPVAKVESQHYNADTTNRNAESVARKITEETCRHNLRRKILLHLIHFTVCCAALAAHAFAV